MAIDTVDYITSHDMDYLEGLVIQRVSHWRNQGRISDLKEAAAAIEKIIEKELDAKWEKCLDDGRREREVIDSRDEGRGESSIHVVRGQFGYGDNGESDSDV